MPSLKPSNFYLSHAMHRLEETGYTPEVRNAVKQARSWHRFILEPEQFGDAFAPADYADDLLQHGLFQLPFDNLVVWMGPYFNKEMILIDAQDGIAAAEIVIVSKRDNTLCGRFVEVTIHETKLSLRAGLGTLLYPLSMSRREWVFSDGFCELDAREKNDSFVADGVLMLGGDESFPPVSVKDAVKAAKERFALTIFELVGFLNSEGIVSEAHREPKFLNKKRAQSGKPPLLSYHMLTVDHAKVKMPGVVAPGGAHASPRLHWRRGHVRRLASGKTTMVKPCLVGDVSRGGIMKDYKFH